MVIKHFVRVLGFCAFLAVGSMGVTAPTFATPSSTPVDEEVFTLQINQPGDMDLTCEGISKEVQAMQDLISEMTMRMDKNRRTQQGVGVAETVGTYAIGSLGGAIGIMAASLIVANAVDGRVDAASALIDAAQQRRSFMAGIYNVKGCMGPLDLADIEPAAGKEEPVNLYQHKPFYND